MRAHLSDHFFVQGHQNLQKSYVLYIDSGFIICRAVYHMEKPSEREQQAAWRVGFQRIYLSHLVAVLRRGRIYQRRTSGRAVKLAADLSLVMTTSGPTAWRRAIFCKYLFRIKKSCCQRRVVKSRRNSQGKRRSVSAKARPYKRNASCDNSGRKLPEAESGLTGTTRLRSRDNRDEVAGGTVASRMQTLRLLVPGSRGLNTPVFLKEAADYIVALKFQVQTMQALADCYSNSEADAACVREIESWARCA